MSSVSPLPGDARDRAEPPAHARRLDRLPHHVDAAGRLERVVGAEPAGRSRISVDDVRPAGERLGRALAARELEPLVREVDADDPLGALQAAAGDRAEADHAGAEDDARRAGLDPRGEHRRAEPGREAAREERRVLERRLGVDLRERDLRHHRVLGERRRAHEVAHRLAVARQARRAVGQVALVLLLADREAEIRARAQAVDALAALRREERDDVVARLRPT